MPTDLPPPYAPFWDASTAEPYLFTEGEQPVIQIQRWTPKPTQEELIVFLVDFASVCDIRLTSIDNTRFFRLKMNQETPHSLVFLQDHLFGGTRVLYTIQMHPKAITFQESATGVQMRLFQKGVFRKRYVMKGDSFRATETLKSVVWRSSNYRKGSKLYFHGEKKGRYAPWDERHADRRLQILESEMHPLWLACFVCIDLQQNLYSTDLRSLSIRH